MLVITSMASIGRNNVGGKRFKGLISHMAFYGTMTGVKQILKIFGASSHEMDHVVYWQQSYCCVQHSCSLLFH